MNIHDITEIAFYALLLGSSGTSLYLWFVKRQRDSRLLKVMYVVRAGCGLFFSLTIPYAFNVLSEAFPLSAIALFAIPFAVISLVLLLPWGLIATKISQRRTTVL